MNTHELKSNRPKLTINLSYNERNEFKAACGLRGREMTEEVIRFIRLYIEGDRAILDRLKERYMLATEGE
jgi:hypothetical protein